MRQFGLDFNSLLKSIRRADLLAALCQETPGDHSIVSREILSNTEQKYEGKEAVINSEEYKFLQLVDYKINRLHAGLSAEEIEVMLLRIKKAKLVPIIRAKSYGKFFFCYVLNLRLLINMRININIF